MQQDKSDTVLGTPPPPRRFTGHAVHRLAMRLAKCQEAAHDHDDQAAFQDPDFSTNLLGIDGLWPELSWQASRRALTEAIYANSAVQSRVEIGMRLLHRDARLLDPVALAKAQCQARLNPPISYPRQR